MNKLKTSIIAKMLAWLLIVISCLGMTGGLLLTSACGQMGLYDRTFEDVRQEEFDRYRDRYSARVLQYLGSKTDSNAEYFAEKNFKYAVVQADSYEQLERLVAENAPENYVERNFEGAINLEEMHIFQCGIGKDTYYSVHNPDTLWGGIWISDTADMDTYTYGIEEYIWDEASNLIYAYANESYYVMPNVQFNIWEEGSGTVESKTIHYQYDAMTKTYQRVNEEYSAYTNADIFVNLTVNDAIASELAVDIQTLTLGEMQNTVLSPERWSNIEWGIANGASGYYTYSLYPFYIDDLTGISGSLFVPYEKGQFDEYGNVVVRAPEVDSTMYYVLSEVPDSLVDYGHHWTESDLFVKFDYVYGALNQFQNGFVLVLIFSVLVFLIAFCFLCVASGHKKGEEGLVPSAVNKIWLEVYGTIIFCLELGAIGIIALSESCIRTEADTFWIGMTIFGIQLALWIGVAALLELETRIKLKCFWKYTCIGWLWNKSTGGIGRVMTLMRENISLMIRVLGACAVIGIIELGIYIMGCGGADVVGLLFFFVEKAVLFGIAFVVVYQLQKLKEAGEHVAVGDLDYKVDTEKMYWDFKKHGENLNSIGDGLANAVEDRMKSERFKTELITNVSHDIKTPLTSIINYVDLLEKENIQDEKVQEYLEVLDRQSARLKKLLEDLMEASKASTGNLSVNMEELEAGVFLTQTVGEFEEKVKVAGLELVIKKPEEPVYIKADGRHFWRVIDNLMNNVAKYAQPDTRVYINLEADEKRAIVTFRNTSRYALNISSEELMERFVRGDESRNTEGSGLGLSIAQSLMELMGGTFDLIVDGDLFKVVLTFERCIH